MKGRTVIADLFVPCLVVGVVGMMVFPLPLALLDLLLIGNISVSLLLLLSALYLADPERFTVLPALLLVTTLFRLALNISTTRQILVFGEAPSTVTAFGSFVVGGEYLVGVVLFLIISIVQFIVIAKGAERVAEVAARFTLDAMPGRQMAIDADVRAGVMNLLEAREQRIELQRESKLYGALDGAMKFVKGDAIAALLIIVVNGVAGVMIGIFSHGLSAEQALKKYTLFTVGDGLVSQIPALLVAVAAGVTVTRVSQGAGGSFGRELLQQLGRDFRAGMIAGGFLILLALAPGLPALPLIGCGGALLYFSRLRYSDQQRETAGAGNSHFYPKVYGPLVVSLTLQAVTEIRNDGSLIDRIQSMRAEFFERSGVLIPEPRFDVESVPGEVQAELFIQGVDTAALLPAGNTGSVTENLVVNLKREIDSHLLELIDDSHTRALLALHRDGNEELVNSLIPTMTTVTALTSVSRCLLAEGVPIRSFPTVLQGIAEYHLMQQDGAFGRSVWAVERSGEADGPGRSKIGSTIAFVRTALKREITRSVINGSEVAAWRLSPEIDDLLAAVVKSGSPLDPEIAQALIQAVERKNIEAKANPPVVLASNLARGMLAELVIGARLPAIVIAPEELESAVPVRILGDIQFSAPEAEADLSNEELDDDPDWGEETEIEAIPL